MQRRSGFAPKCRVLTPNETPQTFETWKETLLFNLTLDGTFEFLLEDNITWQGVNTPNRGFVNDVGGDENTRRSAQNKAQTLKLLLGTIAGYAPVISRLYITNEALCLNDIWKRLRIYYGFRKSGTLILDLPSFHLEEDESPESLWERLYAFILDNLLQPDDGLIHLNQNNIQEELSPTLLNTMIVLWLQTINKSLPGLVKQKYSTELRSKTLASIREDISESIPSLLSDIQGENSINISRAAAYHNPNRRFRQEKVPQYQKKPHPSKFCALCEANDRPYNHFLSECQFLPEADRKYMNMKARMRAVEVEDEAEFYEGSVRAIVEKPKPPPEVSLNPIPRVRKVTVKNAPYLHVKFNDHPVKLILDSGAMSNVMKLDFAKKIGATIYKTTSGATQADGVTNLDIAGEVHLVFQLDDLNLYFDGLVTKDLSDDVLAGVPFMDTNDVYARPAQRKVFFGEKSFKCDITNTSKRADIVRVQQPVVLFPGEALSVPIPEALAEEPYLAIEPRIDAPSLKYTKPHKSWLQPHITQTVNKAISLTNNSPEPVSISKFEHIATIRPTDDQFNTSTSSIATSHPKAPEVDPSTYKDVKTDPHNTLPKQQVEEFHEIHSEYSEVFDGKTLGCYNGASGPLKVNINMGPMLPPPRKGRLPQYNRNQLEELQQICDELDGSVLLKPEDVGVQCEYVNPSFLVNKKNGKKRLVTAFGTVGEYTKPQPTLMPDTNSVLRQIAEYNELIVTDLTSAYWQIELSQESMKYCGIVTPFKGTRVYGRGAMGMPGTETALEELLSRILGDLMTAGHVTKIADDIYCGGSNVEEVKRHWVEVLKLLKKNGLKLSAHKTTVCPKSVNILGWVWQKGTIKASPHKTVTLASVEPPQTVGKLRSYLGGVKFLSRCLKNFSVTLQPLEEVIAGRDSKEKITWTQQLMTAFKQSQANLKKSDTLTLPRRNDQIQIVTDASNVGIGAAMYVIRNKTPMIAGYFSSSFKQHQKDWLPCESEALAINSAIVHFSPYIVDSIHQTTVMSDSLPCVMAYNKLKKGQFSASSRVSSFLSTLCRYNVHLQHLKGKENTYADYASRNVVPCTFSKCQICSYINDTIDSVVRSLSVKDVLSSTAPVPYSSKSGWYELQCSDEALRRTCAHLKQGTVPSRKTSNVTDVKRYLGKAKLNKDGLLTVPEYIPSVGKTHKIIVPRAYIHGLLECLHLKLNHPSKHQLKQVFARAYFALDLDAALDQVSKSCHTCTALSNMPNRFMEQSSTTVPTTMGSNFGADIVKREGQNILVIREYVSAYTAAKLIWNEKAATIRTALLILTSDLIPSNGNMVTIKVDPASACRSLKDDPELRKNGIKLEIGHAKMKNKNPVAEHSIKELHSELNRIKGDSATITEKILSKSIQNMNCRIRKPGVSAREMWTKRNQFTNEQLPIDDLLLMNNKAHEKEKSHIPSAKYKARGKKNPQSIILEKGDLVYINSDRDKLKERERYIVVSIADKTCEVQKFTGNQLRARVYTVNKADLTKVTPWVFKDANIPDSDSDDTDICEEGEEVKEANEDEEVVEANEEDEIEANDTPEETESNDGLSSGEDDPPNQHANIQDNPPIPKSTRSGKQYNPYTIQN